MRKILNIANLCKLLIRLIIAFPIFLITAGILSILSIFGLTFSGKFSLDDFLKKFK